MAGELNITGLVNGFDMNSLLQQIQLIKSKQIYMLQQQQNAISDKKSVISSIQSILKNLQNSISNISDPAVVNAKSVNVSNPNILTASITDSTSVSEGIYNIDVTQLAKNQVFASGVISDKDAPLGVEGRLRVHFGSNYYEAVYDPSYSLQRLADDLNAAARNWGGNFRASIINVGTSDNPQYKLVISGTKTGANNSFTISDAGYNGSGSGQFINNYGMTSIQNAQNAKATVNGLEVESDTNTFTNIPGLSFTALQTGSTVLEIKKDKNPLIDNLNKIVNYYNQLVQTVNKETGKDGKLKGEYGLNQILNGIFKQLEPLYLDDILKFDRTTGYISLNTDKVNEALNNNPSGFQNTLNTIKDNLTNYLRPYTDYNGILDQYNKSYDRQIQNIQNLIDLQTKRIQTEIETLKNQFIKMQMLQAQMNDISARIQLTFGLQNNNK